MFEDITELDNIITENNTTNTKSNKFTKRKETIEEPYVPIAIYVDKEFPPEIKDKLYRISSKLINKKITIRINGDDKEFYNKLTTLSDTHIEVYIPWKGFNDIISKYYWNTITSKFIAQKHFPGWDKIPDSVKSMLARNVRMIFGDKNNSIVLCLITWSKDGANKFAEVNKDTGKSSFIIKLASNYGFPVINIARENAENILEKSFNLT